MSNTKVVQSKPFIIAPICILHSDNPSTNTYRGFINYPTRIKTEHGNELLKCLDSPPQYGVWKKYSTFYALSPMIRPIPTGMKLINAVKLGRHPYNTKEIGHAYDPFNVHQDAISFITWTQPVSATVPLYLHITPHGDSYPSFDKNPPSEGNWTQDRLSPLYVLVNTFTHPFTLDANLHKLPAWELDNSGNPIFLFKGADNRCVPDPKGVSIEQCFLETDGNVLQLNKNIGPTSLIARLSSYPQVTNHSVTNFFKQIPSYVIIVSITLFIISIVTCIIILSNSKT